MSETINANLKNTFLIATAALSQSVAPLSAIFIAQAFGMPSNIVGGLAIAATGAAVCGAVSASLSSHTLEEVLVSIHKGTAIGAVGAASLITAAGLAMHAI